MLRSEPTRSRPQKRVYYHARLSARCARETKPGASRECSVPVDLVAPTCPRLSPPQVPEGSFGVCGLM